MNVADIPSRLSVPVNVIFVAQAIGWEGAWHRSTWVYCSVSEFMANQTVPNSNRSGFVLPAAAPEEKLTARGIHRGRNIGACYAGVRSQSCLRHPTFHRVTDQIRYAEQMYASHILSWHRAMRCGKRPLEAMLMDLQEALSSCQGFQVLVLPLCI